MISATSALGQFTARGFSHVSGVPCSFLKPFINAVINEQSLAYVGATSEGEAVAVSMGAFLAGRKTVTLCQNSGLGNMVNPLTSLNHPFRVPTLLITTWRGQPGVKDEPQHELMGQITHSLLETMRIPWLPFPASEGELSEVLDRADESMRARSLPFALVMSQDTVADCALRPTRSGIRVETEISRDQMASGRPEMIRTEALQALLETLRGDEAILATTGKTGRELFTVADRPNQLYVVGGMGTASAIGLGVSLCLPTQPVVVIDGDGAALMKMGNLATIGYQAPSNFLHILLDNESHDSTGGQRTVSGVVRFEQAAAAANYRNAWTVDSRDGFVDAIQALLDVPGPSLIHVRIRPGSPEKLGRPTVAPHEVKERFMAFLKSSRIR